MHKKLKITLIVLASLVALFVLSIASIMIFFAISGNGVFEYKNISYFDTSEFSTTKNNRKYLLVSGESNSSSLSVKEVKESFDNGDVVVRVYSTIFGSQRKDASFFYAVKIDDSVNRILFGNEKKVIWIRGQ